MSADGIAEVVIKAIEKKGFDVHRDEFRECRYGGAFRGSSSRQCERGGNGDGGAQGGSTTLRRAGGRWIITADHGNAETMIDPVTKGPHTYHTTNPVPFMVVDEARKPLRPNGALQDVAPTILGLLGVAQPKEMTGLGSRTLAWGSHCSQAAGLTIATAGKIAHPTFTTGFGTSLRQFAPVGFWSAGRSWCEQLLQRERLTRAFRNVHSPRSSTARPCTRKRSTSSSRCSTTLFHGDCPSARNRESAVGLSSSRSPMMAASLGIDRLYRWRTTRPR